jgi:hypothetical protein
MKDNEMQHGGENIIFIQYENDIPCSVMTEFSTYDFDVREGDNTDLMYHESAHGKNYNEKDGEKVIGMCWDYLAPVKIWIAPGYKIINTENIELLEKPIPFLGEENPFVNASEVGGIIYCEKCEVYYDDWGCPEHGHPND